MLFNSFDYVLFFPLVFALYWAVPFRAQQALLLVASYLFYGWWGFFEPKLSGWEKVLPLVLLAVSTIFTHVCAKAVYALPEESRRRRIWFWIGVAANIGMLGYFKYRGFFLENVNALGAQFGWTTTPVVMQFILPAGISFYTFQGLSYLIDVDGGSQKPAEKVWDFALFHAFFPQLVAGPIERSRNLLPQLTAPRTLTPEQLWSGLQLIIIGYVKKVAIADAIAPMTREAFSNPASQTGVGLMLALYLFALQIYGDFSGYSDIARGCARLLGVNLMVNFRQPYFARNITEFWERWHISLSTWLRDYVFVPLCRQFRGKKWLNFNLFLTMLISGIWHGASWNFVMWGVVLGLMLVAHKLWSGPKASKHPHRPKNAREWLVQVSGMVLTFHCVCLTLIFVKTASLAHAWAFITGIFRGGAIAPDIMALWYVVFYGLVVLFLDFPCWWRDRELPVADTASPWRRGVTYGGLLLLLAFLGEMEGVSFVYFQF
ncbi:D-alanyl-lipoteichoic acid acyltransferase DltB (MBOAT superfamily) [Roseimicrobium gellanilyticum]|uniref:D-alanyl-lipoteichoic acid acyltransferase DltB (MBOAT superfamily) n=1 Tax=Roseimicrobium gellanilyticum TaxID=748857 RepID=A0A366HMK9_9BACT|nr:MBOAT family O-acyltransferase [Roseimicrobium gellanilyticum]RBP44377.1 D-alanyl-lipoteichoic acid acyltransferase DltB (MBOAT superfamily) [Roseimicrobium gellanilyticum]